MLAFRLSHSRILWPDEDYHIAAGLQLLHGKLLYRDLWYDKPPLAALLYAMFGAPYGIWLRVLGACFVTAASAFAYLLARDLWDRRTGLVAAGLLAFFLTFDLPVAVIPMAPDFLMILPHLAAVYLAIKRHTFRAGLMCGIAVLLNIKGALVLVVCGVICYRSLVPLIGGFLIPNALCFGFLGATGAFRDYVQQVWNWGLAYSRNSPIPAPYQNALRRLLDWSGFHALLVAGAIAYWWRAREHRWLLLWLGLSLVGVGLGFRFVPRYFLQLLPVMVIVGAPGLLTLLQARTRLPIVCLIAALALVPIIRFGPRYFVLAADLVTNQPAQWRDIVMDQDSRAVADTLNRLKHPGDTLLVWGYRPDVYVYSRMPVASRFWDSQPLTGVPADRHLFSSTNVIPQWSARNRTELAATSPTFLVDGLSFFNHTLATSNYPELRDWFARYRIVATTPMSTIYEAR